MEPRILIPLDGSPLATKALDVALGEYPEAKLTAIHVIDPSEPGYRYTPAETDPYELPQHGSEQWYDRAEAAAEELFAAAAEQAAEHDTELSTETVVGRPGREIVRYAETNEIDHIVLSSHGRERASRPLVGSVTEAVVFRSSVRVTLIK